MRKEDIVCTSDGEFCFKASQVRPMPRKKIIKNKSEFLPVLSKTFIALYLSVAAGLAFAFYGSDIEMIARFFGFTIICYFILLISVFISPVMLFASPFLYSALVGFSEIGVNIPSALVFYLSVFVGFLLFIRRFSDWGKI